MLGSQLDLLLLSVLEDGPLHGYAVIAELRRRSDGAFDLLEGTVYPALHRLERAHLLKSRWAREAGRRRRVYELTAEGRRAFADQRQAWREFARGVELVLGGAS